MKAKQVKLMKLKSLMVDHDKGISDMHHFKMGAWKYVLYIQSIQRASTWKLLHSI